MSVIVEFESFPIKKCTIKTTPAMSVQSIINQACTALKLNPPDAYQLQLKKQILQPSLSFRLAGISPGSKLQLIYRGISTKTEKVTIALQTEECGRVIDVFEPTDTLWQMLLHFERKCSINLTRKTGIAPKKSTFQSSKPVYIMPVCVFMNKEYSNIAVLKNTTFVDLGLGSGNGSVRLLEQFTNSPIEEYLSEIENNTSIQPKNVVKVENAINENSNPPNSAAIETKTEGSGVITTGKVASALPTQELIPQGQIFDHKSLKGLDSVPTNEDFDSALARPDVEIDLKVYKPAPDGRSPANIQLPASFYSLNSLELKALIDGQRAKLHSLENRPLMTSALREREQKLREQQYPKTMVRVRFPDRFVLEATFYSGDKVESLFKLVADNLATPGSFRLYVTPPQTDLDPSLSFWKSKLAPASLIHFAPGDSSPGLKHELLETAVDYPVPEPIQADAVEVDEVEQSDQVKDEKRQTQSVNTLSKTTEEKYGEKKTPKWFRLGK